MCHNCGSCFCTLLNIVKLISDTPRYALVVSKFHVQNLVFFRWHEKGLLLLSKRASFASRKGSFCFQKGLLLLSKRTPFVLKVICEKSAQKAPFCHKNIHSDQKTYYITDCDNVFYVYLRLCFLGNTQCCCHSFVWWCRELALVKPPHKRMTMPQGQENANGVYSGFCQSPATLTMCQSKL